MKLRNKKTGEITDLAKRGLLKSDNDNHIIVYPNGTLKYYAYNSLAELNEEWEDYEPKEPLIKDEKVRKAVRAWAEACGAKQIKYSIAPNQYYDADMGTGFSIKFLTKPVEVYLEEGKIYTIAELCGEEEE